MLSYLGLVFILLLLYLLQVALLNLLTGYLCLTLLPEYINGMLC